MRFAVTAPTPNIFSTGSLDTKASTWSGVTVNWPSGFSQSLAIFAMNLFGAIPHEMVMPSSSRTARRISRAMSVALPSKSEQVLTSRKASSSDRGSIMSVKRSKISLTCSDTSLYLAMLPRTITSLGHSRTARLMGMALCTP